MTETKKAPTSRERVLKVYPDARAVIGFHSGMVSIWNKVKEGHYQKVSGLFTAESEAWDDAASRLPPESSPAGAPESMFDPEKVERFIAVDVDRQDGTPAWSCGLRSGPDEDDFASLVRASDYDQLLALYRQGDPR